jgi:hypothetical protein
VDLLPATVVSDREEWVERACEVCRAVHTIPEMETWRTVLTHRGPVAALVLDVTSPLEMKRERLPRWTTLGRQAVSVLCVAPHRGAADLISWARRMGYRRILQGSSIEQYCDDLQAKLGQVIDNRAWLVPEVARAVACFEPVVVEAISVAITLLPKHTTVTCWAKELDLERRQELEGIFAHHGLPGPKTILDWLRLLRVVEYADGLKRRPTRDDLARRFGYSDGRHLGRRAKELSGHPLGQLLNGGLEGSLQALRANL